MADAPTKLLLVEDERIVRITVRDALAKAGYRVTDLADGAAALRAAEAERFDIVPGSAGRQPARSRNRTTKPPDARQRGGENRQTYASGPSSPSSVARSSTQLNAAIARGQPMVVMARRTACSTSSREHPPRSA